MWGRSNMLFGKTRDAEMRQFNFSLTWSFRFVALFVALIVLIPAPAFAQNYENQASQPIPRALSDADVRLYAQIFEVQERGEWTTADNLISRLENRVLLGHVQFQRYMHPTAYRSNFAELRSWMSHYADHPDAARIYRLAMRRQGDGGRAVTRPETRRWRVSAQPLDPFDHHNGARSTAERRRVRQIENHVTSLIRRERPTQSYNYLHEARTRNDLTQFEFDRVRSTIARSYYAEQRDDRALEIAGDVASQSRIALPDADWWAGLAAWRLGEIDQAAEHFRHLATAEMVDPWLRSAGAYWAARSYMRNFDPAQVIPMLEIAAAEPLTFYGILATRQLGRELEVDFDPAPLNQDDLAALMLDRGIERAVAFTQLGRRTDAEAELVRAHGRITNELDRAFLSLTAALDLPYAQLTTAIQSSDPAMQAGLYPVPSYAPEEGYMLDRALVYAFARQESKFNPGATSRVGAMGLMQVLPRTASYITGDRSLSGSEENKLYDPGYNMQVGQLYIDRLMTRYGAGRNLFMLAVAYNGGPGNLRRWRDSIEFQDDPLLFIESIPAPETRGFIEHVLTNLWIYRAQLHQDAPSLDLVAEGSWPVYQSVDTMTIGPDFN